MKISLVIPTHNRKAMLERCLAAALQQTYPDYEVIVIDDASHDGSGELIQHRFPQIRYLRQQRNQGPAVARNRGVAEAYGEIVAFTDDDCLIPPDFLAQLAEGYRRYPSAVGVGGYLEASHELLANNIFAQFDSYVSHQQYGAGSLPYLGGFECPAGATNSMSYRRDVLLDVGCFDEVFPVPGGEDADLKLRVVELGNKVLYVPVEVVHLQPYSLRGFWRQYCNHGRGAVYFERKHNGKLPSSPRLALRLGKRIVRWLPDSIQLGPRLSSAKLLAEIADVFGQWQEVQRLRCLST